MLLEGAIVSDRADLSPIARILDGSSHLLGTWLSEFYCHSYNFLWKVFEFFKDLLLSRVI